MATHLPASQRLLEGKSLLLTGAGRGVGRAHAIELAKLGAKIVVNDIGTSLRGDDTDAANPADNVVAEIAAFGGEAIANYDDVCSWKGALGAVRMGIDAFGKLDGLVNNAGILRKVALADLVEDDFDAIVRVHLKGSFACTVHALNYWRERFTAGDDPRASIVNTFSEAVLVSLPNYSVYGAAKAGVVQLTTVGSREASAYGVRLNAYGPRALTRMTPGADQMDRSVPHPMDPENSSPLVSWLLSDQSAHVTGQVFQTVGGGVARCEGWAAGEMVWPENGRFRFEPEEVGAALNSRVFGCRYPDKVLQEPPGFSAVLASQASSPGQAPVS